MAPLKRPPSQRSRPTTKHAHRSNRRRYAPTAIGVALIAIVMIALQQRLASRSSSPGVSLVKRQRAPTPIHTEADLLRLEALLAAQPLNPDIPKAIRALKLDLFQQWLRAHDDTTIRLDSRSIDGKGVYAARRLGAGRPVLHIPLDRILTTDAIRRTPIGERLRDLNPSVHVLIGTYIALHRRNTSFELYPYLRILPEALDFMAVLANGTALEALRGTSADEIVVQRKNEIDDEWIRVAPAFPTLDGADFLWGVLVSMTRATAIVVNGVRTAGLVPLLNEFRPAHPTQATTTAKIINGYYLITTTKGVGAGDELTRHYGTRSAQMFYSDYAHVPPIITSSDSIRLRFAPIAPVADRIGDVIGTWPRNFLLTSDLDTPSMRQCLAFLRLRVATDPEWIKAQAMTDDLAHIAFIDDDNERRAVQALSSAIQSMIDALRCSAPATLPPNASASYQFAVKQARLMCSIERQLASIILESLPQLPKLAPSSSSAKTALIESGDAFADARQWLIRGGANLSAVDVVSFGDSYRGLVVNRDVSKEELVMVVPVSLCITSITARRTALALEAARNNVTLTPHALMAAMIVDESRKPDSPWRLFLRTLPPSYDNFLIYYTDEEIALLKGTRTLSQFRPFVNEINEDFELVQRAAPIAAASLTFDEYRRARHAVDSRNFIFQPDEDMPKDHIMVPYVDLMNHGVVANTAWRFDAHTASFHVQASATIGAGEALVTSYGDKSNAQLLIGYGFALPDNPYDKTTLRLDAESMCVVQKTFNTIEMADCFLKLRKRFTSEVELLQKMHDGAKKGLSRFKESIDEDQKWADRLLKEPDTGNDHVKFCVLTRLGEKLVLKFWIDATDTLLKYYSGEIARNELDPMYEQYFKVLENPEQHGSKARGKPNSENAEKEIVDSQ